MFWRRRPEPPADRLIAGLGNPGGRYAATRHNVGFEVVALLAQRHGVDLRRTRFRAAAAAAAIGDLRVALLQPHTYMNLSGRAVIRAMRHYGVEASGLLVICDDVNLPPGKIRLRRGGSAGGHKGLASVIQVLGGEEFPRLRIGIGAPPPWGDQVSYVLQRFTREELEVVGQAIQRAADAAQAWLAEGIEAAMNRFNA